MENLVLYIHGKGGNSLEVEHYKNLFSYGENDYLTSLETISDFAKNNNAGLTVMKNGEHWFHTKEEMDFLDQWIKSKLD